MAGRAKVGGATMVRLGDGVADRIDAVAGSGNRAAFIRDAVLEKLAGPVGAPVTAIPQNAVVRAPVSESNMQKVQSPSDARPEFPVLLAHLKKAGPRSEREAARDLGWPEGKVKAAAKGLTDAGLISYDRGSMVVQP